MSYIGEVQKIWCKNILYRFFLWSITDAPSPHVDSLLQNLQDFPLSLSLCFITYVLIFCLSGSVFFCFRYFLGFRAFIDRTGKGGREREWHAAKGHRVKSNLWPVQPEHNCCTWSTHSTSWATRLTLLWLFYIGMMAHMDSNKLSVSQKSAKLRLFALFCALFNLSRQILLNWHQSAVKKCTVFLLFALLGAFFFLS